MGKFEILHPDIKAQILGNHIRIPDLYSGSYSTLRTGSILEDTQLDWDSFFVNMLLFREMDPYGILGTRPSLLAMTRNPGLSCDHARQLLTRSTFRLTRNITVWIALSYSVNDSSLPGISMAIKHKFLALLRRLPNGYGLGCLWAVLPMFDPNIQGGYFSIRQSGEVYFVHYTKTW